MITYILDNSSAASRSEDYSGSRLAFELAAVRLIAKAPLLVPGGNLDSALTPEPSLTVLTSGGRPATAVPPAADAAALLGLDVACHAGEQCQLLAALRLALLAAKRTPTSRVMAFVASEPDLDPEQCRQVSGALAAARLPLDVIVLGCRPGSGDAGGAELSEATAAALDLLTSAASYGPAPPAPAEPAGAGGRPRRPVPPAGGNPAAFTAAGAGAGAQGPQGQRVVYYPPPPASLALWQQLEPLLEALGLEGAQGAAGGEGAEGAEAEDAADASPETDQDDGGLRPRPSAPVTGSTASSSGRPPLPRPPRPAAATPTAPLRAGRGGPGSTVGGRPGGGGLTRGGLAAAGNCRYESLDSLQHLSVDGFLRSWLPSYANVSRVFLTPQQQAQATGPRSASTSPGNRASSAPLGAQVSLGASLAAGGGGEAAVAAGGADRGRLCYISVYRLQLPRWHKLLEVNAGCMLEVAEPPAAAAAAAPAAGAGAGAAVAPSAATAAAAAPPPPLPPLLPYRQGVAVARAPCPVQVSFSTACSSAAAAVAGGGGGPGSAADGAASGSPSSPSTSSSGGPRWVVPDLRRGSLSLVASVDDPGVVKLLWSERQPDGGAASQQQQYGSIFAAAEGPGDGGVDVAGSELELTLSPTRTVFRVVPQASGGGVLEVRSPRSVVHRPKQGTTGGGSAGSGSAGSSGAAGTSAPSSSSGAAAGSDPAASSQPQPPAQSGQSGLAPSGQSGQPQAPRGRYFFWLQQDWPPPQARGPDAETEADAEAGAEDTDAEAAAASEHDHLLTSAPAAGRAGLPGARPPASTGGGGGGLSSLSGGCRALAEELQALLECPPEFDPAKHGNRVRCSNTPLQLGPLPLALVEEIMRASGRELNSDGTISTVGPGASGRASGSGAGGSGSGGSAAASMAAAVIRRVAAARRGAAAGGGAGGSGGEDGLCSLAMARSPGGAVGGSSPGGSGAAGATPGSSMDSLRRAAAAEGRQGSEEEVAAKARAELTRVKAELAKAQAALAAGGGGSSGGGASSISLPPRPVTRVGPVGAPSAPAATAAAAAGPVPPTTPGPAAERREPVRGVARTTYSRGAAAPPPPAAAGRALSSHPLDEMDWAWSSDEEDCDNDEDEEGGTGASALLAAGVPTPQGAGAGAGGEGSHPAVVCSPPHSPAAGDRHRHLCEAGGAGESLEASEDADAVMAEAVHAAAPSLAVAAAAAAADAAEGGGSCADDNSLLFELD